MFQQETWDFICAHRNEDVHQLALKKPTNDLVDLKQALVQIEGYQTARRKLPQWADTPKIIFPPRISMEQCSSEVTARYKRQVAERLLKNLRPPLCMADMTGGFGIDFSYLAPLFDRAVYIEQQEVLCRIAAHNMQVLQLNPAEVCCGNGTEIMPTKAPLSLVFIDPARRDTQGKKTVALADCTPNLEEVAECIVKCSSFGMAKLSPMLDIHQALTALRQVSEVHVVSVDNECKELLLVLQASAGPDVRMHCINLQKGGMQEFSYNLNDENEAEAVYTDQPDLYLYEPNASLLKAGAFKCLCKQYKVQKLHPNSHLYTSDTLLPEFPGRRFRIMNRYALNKQDMKRLTKELPKANITIRNFPSSVQEMRKKMKIKEGGDHYLFLTTLKNEEHVILDCVKADGAE